MGATNPNLGFMLTKKSHYCQRKVLKVYCSTKYLRYKADGEDTQQQQPKQQALSKAIFEEHK